MKFITPKLISISIISVSLAILYLASQMLLSGVYSLQSNIFLEHWQQNQTAPQNAPWQTGLTASQKAQNYYPVADAFLQEKIGKTYQWNTFTKLPADEAASTNRSAALQAYRQQTKLTPNWPKAWFNLLSIKIELNQFDQEFYQAFAIAKQTTQQTPGMLTQYTIIGIQAYQGVNNKIKSEILRNIVQEAQISKRSSQNLKSLLQAYNLLNVTCIYANAIKANTYNLCI